MDTRHATQRLARRLGATVLALSTVYAALGALNACQAALPVSPEMRCAFEPGCGATDYPWGMRDGGRE